MFTADTSLGERESNSDNEIKDILIIFFIKTKPPFNVILSKYIFKYTRLKRSNGEGESYFQLVKYEFIY